MGSQNKKESRWYHQKVHGMISCQKVYPHEEGFDFKGTFSPFVKFSTIKLILAIVAKLDLELYHMNVKTVPQ